MADCQPYEPPRITPLTFTAVGKHLTANVGAAPEFDEAYAPADLLARYGSPLFVVSERALRDLYRYFADTFSEPGIETRIAYSYKTNYLPAICAIFREEGAWAEVVSGMEYELARSMSVPPEEIIFNGPHKTKDELTAALGQGAIVNIDNFDELDKVEAVAGTLGKPFRIGTRVNFRYGPQPWTKFGFNDANGSAQTALERIARHPNLELQLLHNHCGTFQLVYDIYAQAVEMLIRTAKGAIAGTINAVIGAALWTAWMASPLAAIVPPLLIPFILATWLVIAIGRRVLGPEVFLPSVWSVVGAIRQARAVHRPVIVMTGGGAHGESV